MLAVGQTTSRCPKTLENHSGADTRTEAKLLVLGFNFTRMLLVTHIKYGSFCENAHAAENQHFLKLDYKRITFLTKIFLQEKCADWFIKATCVLFPINLHQL